jgi:hypothetical protein
MLPIKIHISCTQLPRTAESLDNLLSRISCSAIANREITLIHGSDWDGQINEHGLNINYFNCGYDTQSLYEFPALSKMRQDGIDEDYYGLYLHVKGASKTDEQQWQNALAWQDYMMQCLVDRAETCIQHLQRGADYVGSQWHWHWKGNFFWHRSQYTRQLVEPMSMDLDYRNNCEHWSSYSYWWGRYPLPRIKNMFYLPLTSDDDYIKLKQANYQPEWDKKNEFNSTLQSLIDNPWYGAFDIMRLTGEEIANYRDFIKKYLNYDSVVIDSDTDQHYEAEYFY